MNTSEPVDHYLPPGPELIQHTPEFITRCVMAVDHPFVFSNWRKGARNAMSNKILPWPTYFELSSRRISEKIKNSKTVLAVHPDDPSEAFGFLCYDYDDTCLTVHWLYVKSMWRRAGVASGLLDKVYPEWRSRPILFTESSDRYSRLKRRFPNLTSHTSHRPRNPVA